MLGRSRKVEEKLRQTKLSWEESKRINMLTNGFALVAEQKANR